MIYIYGLGLTGYVTAACLASWGRYVTLMHDDEVLPAIPAEPGLEQRLQQGRLTKRIRTAMIGNEVEQPRNVAWCTFDTPIDDLGNGNVAWVRSQCNQVCAALPAEMLVLLSSQVPVGFCKSMQQRYPQLTFVVIPENIRRGHAIADFYNAVPIVGAGPDVNKGMIESLFTDGLTRRSLFWTTPETAEMIKLARNAYLALTCAFAYEVASAATLTGADYDSVQKALRLDPRIGQQAYLEDRKADGRHLLRDVRYLNDIQGEQAVDTWLMQEILRSSVWAI